MEEALNTGNNRTRSQAKESDGLGQITDRDVHVARLIGDGCTNREIASQTGLVVQSVKNTVSRLYLKLSIRKQKPRIALALFIKLYGIEVGPAPVPVRETCSAIQ